MNKIPQKLVSFLMPILNALSYNPNNEATSGRCNNRISQRLPRCGIKIKNNSRALHATLLSVVSLML